MADDWRRGTLGRTGIRVGRIGLGASFGIGQRDVERAFDRGVNYLYWGSRRTAAFGRAIRAIARRDRDGLVTVVQSYTRVAAALRPSVELALRQLGTDYTDLLLLGWWRSVPPLRIVDAARKLREQGKVKHLMVSAHHRPLFVELAATDWCDTLMVRYNAAHRGAEREVFPHLPERRPGVVGYTATRWKALIDPALTPPGEPTPRASDCYRFALSHPSVDLCLSGPKNGAELDEALAALDRGPMDDDELAWMRRVGDAVYAAPPSRSWRNPANLLDRIASAVGRG